MSPEELAALAAAIVAATPLTEAQEKAIRRRETEKWMMDTARAGDARRARNLEEWRRNPPPPPPPVPRAPSLGPPCPFADLPAANLTDDQRFAVRHWDNSGKALRDEARARAAPPGELSADAHADIARWAAELVPDEYATVHASTLRHMYGASPAALSTMAANYAAFNAAFAAGGLVPDPSGCFQVRVADDDSLGFTSGEDTIEPTLMIVPGLIPAGCQVAIVGDQASGKTTLIASLLAAVANGRQWLGRPTLRTQCAIINWDGRDSDLRQLLHDAGAQGKVSIASYPEDKLTSDRLWQAIERRYGNGKPALIAIDSLSRGSDGVDEKDARFADPVLRAAELSSRFPITFIWNHHTPVTVRGKGLNDWLRGTSALGAAFDIAFGLAKVSASSSPRETIVKIETLKMRPRGIVPPAPFKVRITDAGLALHETRPAAAMPTDDEKVLAVVRETPGITSEGIAAAVKPMRASDTRAARGRLDAAGTIENRGSARDAEWFATVPC